MWCQAAQATAGRLMAELEAKDLQCKQLAAKPHDRRQDQLALEGRDGASGALQIYGLQEPDEESLL